MRKFHIKPVIRRTAVLAVAFTLTVASGTTVLAAGFKAELRSSSAIIPATPGATAPTAPAGAVIVGPQAWACDAAGGFAPVIAVQQNVSDPILQLEPAAE